MLTWYFLMIAHPQRMSTAMPSQGKIGFMSEVLLDEREKTASGAWRSIFAAKAILLRGHAFERAKHKKPAIRSKRLRVLA